MKKPRKIKLPAKRPVGRPEHEPDARTRKKVRMLIATGMSQSDVAAALGIGQVTLTKHYAEDIATGKARTRAEVVGMLMFAAKTGQVSAQRKLIGLIDGEQERQKIRSRDRYPPVGKEGKKELQQREAEEVSELYVPPSTPKLVVNNS